MLFSNLIIDRVISLVVTPPAGSQRMQCINRNRVNDQWKWPLFLGDIDTELQLSHILNVAEERKKILSAVRAFMEELLFLK